MAEALDLTNCDREPIHIPGQIQAHGALLALGLDDLCVLQATANTKGYLGAAPAQLFGQPLEALLAGHDAATVRRALLHEHLEQNPLHLFTGRVREKGPFHVIGHVHDGLLLLELEPAEAPAERPDFYELLKSSIARFQHAQGVVAFGEITADEVRRLSGYDRVMIYRFAPDWSGHVIAESMAAGKGLSPFLDLHYPASDIPSQARALFVKNTVRMLPDARYVQSRIEPELNPRTGRPLDLSYAFLRGASQMYTEYLTNMGVGASLTMAITRGDHLWGMIACHHYGTRRVPYDVRTACELLARVVSLQMADKERLDEAEARARSAEVHERLVRSIAQQDDVAKALLECEPDMGQLIACGGGAVVSGGVCHRFGDAPPASVLLELAKWLGEHASSDLFAAESLPAAYPPASAFRESMTGLLAVKASADYLLWFRPELLRTVKWAGDPSKPVEMGPMGDRLTPRKSFELWQETVRGRSAPWLPMELEAARKLRVALTEIVHRRGEELARLNLELSRSNQELDSFAYAASHDLKEPLRGIYNYATFLLQDAGEKLAEADQERLKVIVRLTRRMQSLIYSLLHFARLGRGAFQPVAVELGAAVREALETLDALVRESGARVEILELPAVAAEPSGLQEILTNLISNALKYNDKPQRLVTVGSLAAGDPDFPARAAGRAHCFYVRDNGIGIAQAFREDVFRIFRRLHALTAFGGGTGAGLTIARKMVQRHGGELWCESVEGQGTTFFFTLAEAAR